VGLEYPRKQPECRSGQRQLSWPSGQPNCRVVLQCAIRQRWSTRKRLKPHVMAEERPRIAVAIASSQGEARRRHPAARGDIRAMAMSAAQSHRGGRRLGLSSFQTVALSLGSRRPTITGLLMGNSADGNYGQCVDSREPLHERQPACARRVGRLLFTHQIRQAAIAHWSEGNPDMALKHAASAVRIAANPNGLVAPAGFLLKAMSATPRFCRWRSRCGTSRRCPRRDRGG
jgi:hypothetical protein